MSGKVSNSAVYAHYLVDYWNLRHSVLLSVLSRVLRDRAFVQLRTNEQLGYIVSAGQRTAQGASGIVLIVQSGVKVRFNCYKNIGRLDWFIPSRARVTSMSGLRPSSWTNGGPK